MSAVAVSAALPRQRRLALELLLRDLPAAERRETIRDVLSAADQGETCLDGLLIAWRAGRPVGAALYLLQPGHVAFLWPPSVAERAASAEVEDVLLQQVCRELDAAGVKLAQSLLEAGQDRAAGALLRNGFPYITELLYLEHPVRRSELPPRTGSPERIVFSPETNRHRFAEVIERTYIGSMDCPSIHGTRSGLEALESHASAGVHDPSLWWIYSSAGEDAGVLLLTSHPEQNAWEVVYVGVVPEARGRGLGRTMMIDALQDARVAGRELVLLAVDCENISAQRIYDSLGFVETTRRAVHLRLRPGGGETFSTDR